MTTKESHEIVATHSDSNVIDAATQFARRTYRVTHDTFTVEQDETPYGTELHLCVRDCSYNLVQAMRHIVGIFLEGYLEGRAENESKHVAERWRKEWADYSAEVEERERREKLEPAVTLPEIEKAI